MYGVAYTIARRRAARRRTTRYFTGASGMKVYRRDVFPRAWAVHELVRVPNAGEGNLLVVREPESFRRRAHMVGPPPPVQNCTAPDTVQLIEHAPDRLAIRAEMACDGLVVLSDTFHPGWRARRSPSGRNLRESTARCAAWPSPRDGTPSPCALPPRQRLSRRGAVAPVSILGAMGWAAFAHQRLGGRSDSMLRNIDSTTNAARTCATHMISALH